MEATALPELTRDLRKSASTLTVPQARILVDLYYQMQDFRIQANNQVFALGKTEEPHDTVTFFHGQFFTIEKDVAKALDTYSASQELGEWARTHTGIGPVIAAGLLANIPIETTPSPSSLWRFAGLAPGQHYVKGQKRDWNAGLKLLCWKMGDSFVKNAFRDTCYYGHLYKARKELEVARNNSGRNRESAAQQLKEKNIRSGELKVTLESGKLPDQQLDLRARRYAVKRFLVHYWQAAWIFTYGTDPKEAYVFSHLGHDPRHNEENPFVPLPALKEV